MKADSALYWSMQQRINPLQITKPGRAPGWMGILNNGKYNG